MKRLSKVKRFAILWTLAIFMLSLIVAAGGCALLAVQHDDNSITLPEKGHFELDILDLDESSGLYHSRADFNNAIELDQNRPPILLVHGFQTKGFDLDEIWESMVECLTDKDVYKYGDWEWVCDESQAFGSEFRIKRLEGNGFITYISNYTHNTQDSTRFDIRRYAQSLAQEIKIIKNKECVNEVDIVAFSMGGLVARTYIETEDLHNSQHTTEYQNDVRKLIMIGTPNHGFFFPDFFDFMYKLLGWQCVPQMKSGSSFLSELNEGVTGKQKGVEYSAIAGSAYQCRPVKENLLSVLLCWLYGQNVNDGVVTVGSVKLEKQGELDEMPESRWFVLDLTHFKLRSELTGHIIEDILTSPILSKQ